MSSAPARPAFACYGLRFAGLGAQLAEVDAPDSWPLWTISQVREQGLDRPELADIAEDSAVIGIPPAGEVRLDRPGRTIEFATAQPISDAALLHPGLVAPSAVIGLWLGRASVHSSAVCVGDTVWGLLADREGGKSTTAALLAEAGVEFFTDDMLIIDGSACFSGPPSIDLRPESAHALGGEPLGRIGARERWRQTPDVRRLEGRLGGFVRLEWSPDDAVVIDELSVGERMRCLDEQVSVPVSGTQLLDLVQYPMLRFARPRDLGSARNAVARLADALTAC